jgi:hypothetical protein
MKCNEFTREQLIKYASSWSIDMEEGLWHKIWDHCRSCPSCFNVVLRASEDRRKEEATCKEQFPNLSKIAETQPPLNWDEINFKHKRRRKLEIRKLAEGYKKK